MSVGVVFHTDGGRAGRTLMAEDTISSGPASEELQLVGTLYIGSQQPLQ